MSDLPSGTVTFLFTDIEGSTKLLDQLGADLYGRVLSGQRTLLRANFAEFNGQEIDTQGDSFFASFPRASEAVAAVVQIQQALAEHNWPEGVEVRVRMGLHTGEPWLIEEGYVGMDVHRAARIAHVGHGGQVLLSETTTPLVRNELPADVRLLDLGRHQLKDVRHLESLHQLIIPGLPGEFAPLNTLESFPPYSLSAAAEQIVREPREVGLSPYRGLAAFRESDAPYFYGREDFTEELYDTVTRKPMTAVIVGSSGAGKSSAVAAGLLPRLRSEGDWLVLRFRPGSQPFHALAAVVLPLLEPELAETERLISAAKLAEALLKREVSLTHIVERLLEKRDQETRVLLIADQFEELYTLCPDLAVRQGFLDELLEAVHRAAGQPPARLVLLLTLRADFMGQALTHRPFADELKEGALLLGPMNRVELQAAIEKPAEKQGAAFETGLVARILDDVGEEPGNLPLLEFALTLLWDQLDQGWLTHAAYDEIGRVEGALSRHADEVYARLPDEEQEQARRIFVQLVQPGEGTEDTRRVARQADLVGVDWKLVQRMADERLVVTSLDETGSETVEVVHEALIRSWGRLREWMNADREFRRWQEGLRAARRAWEESDRDDGALLRGGPLVSAEDWLEKRDVVIGVTEQEYIQASVAAREGRAEVERTQLARERELEQRAVRRLRLIVGVLVAASILGIILSGAIFNQNQIARGNETLANQNAATAEAERIRAEQEADGRATQQVVAEAEQARAEQEASARATAQAEAEDQAKIALSRELAAEAVNNLGEEPERSVLLALQALKTTYTQEAEEALHRALPNLRLLHTMVGHEDGFSDLAYSPDGSRLVSTSWDGTIRVWNAATGQELIVLSQPEEEFIRGRYAELAYSGDGSYFATAGNDGTAKVWDAATGELLTTFTGHRDIPRLDDPDSPNQIVGLVVSPDSKTIATSDRAGLVKLWNAATGAELKTLDLSETAPYHWRLRFSSDGLRLIVFGYDPNGGFSTLRMIEIDSGTELLAISERMASFDVSPNWSRLIFTEAYENVVHLWDLDAMAEIANYSTGEVANMAFSPDGSLFATLARDLDTVQLWETETGTEVMAMPTSHGHVSEIIFSPDGASLATAGWDKLVKVWDITPDYELMTVHPFSEVGSPLVTQIRFSQDGTMLAAGGVTGGVSVWNPTTGKRLLSLAGHDDWVGGLGFSPDGDRLASGADDKLVKVWDTSTGELLLTLTGHEDWVNNIAYSPDGATIASIGNDSQSFIWDATTGEVLHQIPLQNLGWGITYSPDGAFLATGSLWNPEKSENVTIWDVATGQAVRVINNKEGADELLFSKDGSLLITGGVDGFVRIWDVETGQLLQEIEADQSVIFGASLSPDGTILATAAAGSDVRLWDLQSGERLLTLDGSEEGIQLVEFTADGEQIVTAGGQSGYMRFLVLSVDELVDLAESRLTRTLTDEECQEYLHMDSCPVE